MDLSETAILAMKRDDLLSLCNTLKIVTNNSMTKSALHALIKLAREANAKDAADSTASVKAKAIADADALKKKTRAEEEAAIDAALAVAIKNMQDTAAAKKAQLDGPPPDPLLPPRVPRRDRSPRRGKKDDEDSGSDDDGKSGKSRKKHRAARSERKMSDLEYDMFAALADVLHMDIDDLLDVVQRWTNKQVALNPGMWLAMFALHPVAFSEIQEAGTGLEGQLIRQLRQLWEVRFPSATATEIAGIIRSWATAYDIWCATQSREASVNWPLFLERQAAPLRSWMSQMALLQDRELRLTFQGPTILALQQRRGAG